MKHLTVLVPEGEGNNISSIVGSYKIFSRANEIRQKQGLEPVFKIVLAGVSDEQSYYGGLFSINPHTNISKIEKTDLIIIPAINFHDQRTFEKNEPLISWIQKQYLKCAEIASICTGAFLLAATGLMDGKKCSTHWAAKEVFIAKYPTVDLQTDLLITDENGIYTNGGAYSFLNLLFYLVEKYYDREIALMCSRIFQIDISRNSQSEFIIFSNQKSHQDDTIKEAQTYIENHIEEKISVEYLCRTFSVARRNFDRRFIKATGNSPLEYIQRVKVESAKRSLEQSRKTINEIMFDVGYSDVKAFREVFKKITGLTPTDYKEKYSKNGVFGLRST
jgi:transcriptional regulator GlxA family with amidase domain